MAINLENPVAWRAFRTKRAARNVVAHVRDLETALRQQLAEISRHREQAEALEAAQKYDEMVNVASFAIHYASGNRGVRLDLLAGAMADLKHYTREE